MSTEAHCHGLIAEKPMTPEQQASWNHANAELVGGFQDQEGEWDPQRFKVFLRSQLDMFRALGGEFDYAAVMAELDKPKPNGLTIYDQLLAVLGEETVANLMEEKKLH
jgi:hypothetical protein